MLNNKNDEIARLKKELKRQKDEYESSNEELIQLMEEISAQREAIEDKNKELIKANARLDRNEKILIQAYKNNIQKEAKLKELNEELIANKEELTQLSEELSVSNEILNTQNTKLENALEQLKNTQSSLIQSEKMASLGVLAAGVAHEINNPLNFIQGGISGIEQYFTNNFTEHLDKISPLILAIKEGVKRAANIVKSLSHYSRNDSLEFTEAAIHIIIDNCLLMLHNQLKNKVEINKQYAHLPYNAIGNEGKLHQAFLNILANAGQAIEKKGSLSIATKALDNFIEIKIKDTGTGISKENLNKIFTPFFTTKEPGKGVGLGLSISYAIIEEHNGSIKFESEINNGTTCTIKLPIYKPSKP